MTNTTAITKYVLKTKKKGKEVFNMHLLNDRDMHCSVRPFFLHTFA